MNSISARELRRAADLKEKIEELHSELNKLLGGDTTGNGTPAAKSAKKPGRRKMSAAGRAKIAAAARARWKKAKSEGKKSL